MKQFAASVTALTAMAAASQAASVTFWTLDKVQRTVYFSPSPGSAAVAPVAVSCQENTTVRFADHWVGNFYAIPDGGQNKPGMLGEVQFAGWLGKTYFDVSAIVDGADHDNIKQMWPKESQSPMSGCEVFPCNNCYWLSDDVQTKVTEEMDLVTTLGAGSTGIAFADGRADANTGPHKGAYSDAHAAAQAGGQAGGQADAHAEAHANAYAAPPADAQANAHADAHANAYAAPPADAYAAPLADAQAVAQAGASAVAQAVAHY